MAQVKANSVNVAIRVRPLIEWEIKKDIKRQWIVGENELRPCDSSQKSQPNNEVYIYDHVFNENSSTKDVYDKVVAPIVNESFHGFNGTILCYGQTSSGKTHTLYGSDTEKGIIVLFADHLFDRIEKDEGKRQYIIKVGLMEIYNEKVIDLFNSDNVIEIQQRDGRVVPGGLKEETIVDRNDLCDVADRIQRQRRIGETRMNKESSRSHTIARVTIESFDDLSSSLASGDNPTNANLSMTSAVLHFVDLAGSEKQAQTGAEGERFKEAIHINKSLSCLSRVVQQLSENAAAVERSQPSRNQLTDALCTEIRKPAPVGRFVSYRDSKLTRLLQSSLSGDAYTSMICNVTPASLDETKSTLNFAKLAKKIEIAPKQNLCSMEYEEKLQELQKIIQGKDKEMLALKRQVENLQYIYKIPPAIKTQIRPNLLSEKDRRHSLCPELLQRLPAKNYASTEFGFPKLHCSASEETFLSTEETMRHFQQLTTIRESALSGKGCYDKEIQTEACIQSPKKPKLESSSDTFTPVQTLRMASSLLRETNEADRFEWLKQKQFLESENESLKEEASKVSSFQKRIEILENEKKELENDVMRQIQSSQLTLKRQQAEFEEKMATIRCGSDHAFKEDASKVIELQTKIDALINEKKDIEKSVSQQVQTLQSKLLEQKADFEKKLVEEQSSRLKPIMTTQGVECELVKEEELIALKSENESLKHEASKVSSFQKDIEILKNEKKELEDDVMRQIQSFQLTLKRQQAEFEEKMATIRCESDQAKEDASKVTELQTTIDALINEKKDIERSVSQQVQTFQSALYELQSKLLEQKAEFEKKLVEEQSSRLKPIMTTQGVECDLVTEDELIALKSENESLKQEASKVSSFQKDIEMLKNEKKELDNDANQQIQSSQSVVNDLETKLSEQKADFEKQLAEEQSSFKAIMTARALDLVREEKLLDDKRLLESEVQSLKKEASKVPSLQMEVDILKDEKRKLENDVMQQIQSSQSVVSGLETKLSEQKADFEKQLAEEQSSFKAIMTTRALDLVREEKLLDDKRLLESEVQSLKEEASKVPSLQMEVDILKDEKRKLENDVVQQIQSSQSVVNGLETKLMEQKAEFEKKLTENLPSRLKPIMTTQGVECDLVTEEELIALKSENESLKQEASKVSSFQKDIETLKNEKEELENKLMQQIQSFQLTLKRQQAEFEEKMATIRCKSDQAKEDASKVTELQTKIDALINEKKDIENSVSQQVQTLQSKLLEQKADFEKKLAEEQSSRLKPIMTTQGVECDLVREDELIALKSENESLKQEASKVSSFQKDVETLKNEKKELENDVKRQIQSFQLKLKCQQAEFDEKMATIRCGSDQALKEHASKVTELQTTINDLINEKRDIEKSVSQQVQTHESALYVLQSKLLEQRADFEKKLAENQPSRSKPIMTTRGVECDLVREDELIAHYRHRKAQAIAFERQLLASKEKVREKNAKIAELEKLVKTYQLSEKQPTEKQSSSSNRIALTAPKENVPVRIISTDNLGVRQQPSDSNTDDDDLPENLTPAEREEALWQKHCGWLDKLHATAKK